MQAVNKPRVSCSINMWLILYLFQDYFVLKKSGIKIDPFNICSAHSTMLLNRMLPVSSDTTITKAVCQKKNLLVVQKSAGHLKIIFLTNAGILSNQTSKFTSILSTIYLTITTYFRYT
jgi:hypothetical protein